MNWQSEFLSNASTFPVKAIHTLKSPRDRPIEIEYYSATAKTGEVCKLAEDG
jgi:hypothetical protein